MLAMPPASGRHRLLVARRWCSPLLDGQDAAGPARSACGLYLNDPSAWT